MKTIISWMTALLMICVPLSGCSSDAKAGDMDTEPTPAFAVTDDTEAVPESEEITEPETEEEPMKEFVFERVVLLGVDGAGAFFRDADTPNIDRIFENGSKSFDVLTSDPTISAECWGSMLHGVTPNIHRLTNGIVASNAYDPESPFPSAFRVIRENDPDAVLASFCNWNPINVGIIEDNLNVHKDTAKDAALTEKICDYVAENDPKFLFVQFDEVDGAGHGNGYGTQKHLDQIAVTDGYIQKIYEAYEKRGFLDTTLFIVTADHGGKGTSHGGLSDGEKYVMFAAVGGNVVKGGIIEDMEIRDCASIVLHALGYEQPSTWTGRVPSGLFEGVTAGERPVYEIEYTKEYRTAGGGETPDPSALTAIFGDRIAAYLSMDETIESAIGDYKTEQGGKLYYVTGYTGSGIKFDDGYISLKPYSPDNSSFSACMWMKTGGVSSDPVLISNKDWGNGSKPGFVLSLRSGDVKFNSGNGSSRMDAEYQLPLDYADGWVHLALVVDREAGEVRFAYDFGSFVTVKIPDELKDSTLNAFRNLNIGQDGTCKYSQKLSAVLDDFILLDGAMTQEDLTALAAHYGISE